MEKEKLGYKEAKAILSSLGFMDRSEYAQGLRRIVYKYELAYQAKLYAIPLTTTQKLAVFLHEITCHYSHTDYCGWYYEITHDPYDPDINYNQWPKEEDRHPVHDWSQWTHKHYLERAEKLLKKLEKFHFTEEQLIEVITAIERPDDE